MLNKTLILFTLLLAVFMIACSDDSPMNNGEVNEEVIATLSREGSVATYKRQSLRYFEKGLLNNSNDWEEVNLDELNGFRPVLESTLCFQDGKLWEPIVLFTSITGPYPVGRVWNAYKRVTHTSLELYVKSKFDFDVVNSTMEINGKEFKVLEFTDKELRLNYESLGCNSYGETWPKLEVYRYTLTTPKRFDSKYTMAFDSDVECYRYIIDVAREKFGRYINLNEVYAGEAYLEEPIIDLDEVEAWVNEQEQKQK